MAGETSTTTDTAKLVKQLSEANKLLRRFTSLRLTFTRGVLAGLGGILGATIVITIILWGISKLQFVPIIGNFATQVVDVVIQNSAISDPRKLP